MYGCVDVSFIRFFYAMGRWILHDEGVDSGAKCCSTAAGIVPMRKNLLAFSPSYTRFCGRKRNQGVTVSGITNLRELSKP